MFGITTILQPYAAVGGTHAAKDASGKPRFFCNTCGKNSDHNSTECKKLKLQKGKYCSKCKTTTHNTVDCKPSGEASKRDKTGGGASADKKQTYTGKILKDGAKGVVPEKPDYVCSHCKIPGHYRTWCPKV